jgi:hypothetical protein
MEEDGDSVLSVEVGKRFSGCYFQEKNVSGEEILVFERPLKTIFLS